MGGGARCPPRGTEVVLDILEEENVKFKLEFEPDAPGNGVQGTEVPEVGVLTTHERFA